MELFYTNEVAPEYHIYPPVLEQIAYTSRLLAKVMLIWRHHQAHFFQVAFAHLCLMKGLIALNVSCHSQASSPKASKKSSKERLRAAEEAREVAQQEAAKLQEALITKEDQLKVTCFSRLLSGSILETDHV